MFVAAVAIPNELFTPQSLLTFGGAMTATYVITNAVKAAAGWSAKWFGLVVAEGVCIGGVLLVPYHSGESFVIAVLNGCVVYLAAAGGTQATAVAAGGAMRGAVRSDRTFGKRFLEPWF